MRIVLIIIGGILGIWLAELGEEMLGMVLGAVAGLLLAQRSQLQAQINELKRRLGQVDAASEVDPGDAVVEPPTKQPLAPSETRATDEAVPVPAALQAAQPSALTFEAGNKVPAPDLSAEKGAAEPPRAEPGLAQRAVRAARLWLTTGNVPVKLGVLVSFFGVAFLLKYAVDQQIFSLPIELRYLAVAAGAVAMLGVGWRLREGLRVYSLSLQGGGVGVLYLTIFGAFRLHDLLPPLPAFGLLVVLTASTGVLAVVQNARALAVLGIVGGFLAPVLISTGSGNHVGLFSYYALLNLAVLGIAWFRAWRFLNVLSFVFTFGVGAAWGAKYYRPELFASTEPFLVGFFLFFQAIAVLFALRQPPRLRGLVDGSLVFGTPVVAFALQARVIEHIPYGLAYSALAAAVVFVAIGYVLSRRADSTLRTLVEAYVALAVALATIAVPLALDDRWTAVAWALEGAALVWVGVRQSGVLARLTGTALLLASGVAFLRDGWSPDVGLALLNGNFIGGALIGAASLFSAQRLAADSRPFRFQSVMSVALLLWGLGWWLGTGAFEIADHGNRGYRLAFFTAYLAATSAGLAWLARRLSWVAARRATLGYLPLLVLVAFAHAFDQHLFFDRLGLPAWLLALAAHLVVLRRFDARSPVEGAWHGAGALLATGVVAVDLCLRVERAGLGEVWAISAGLAAAMLGAAATMSLIRRVAWPFAQYAGSYLAASGVMLGAMLFGVGSAGVELAGDPSPLPYVPILNPLDLLTAAALLLALRWGQALTGLIAWLDADRVRVLQVLWAAAAFSLSTVAVIRGVHHAFDVPWQRGVLTGSVAVQSALSIYWAILGFGGMIWGARRGRRAIWMVGTALMGLVVLKLFLVDLGNTGTVARIVSFLGVGVMLLVVGYLAPAPPNQSRESEG